MDDFAERASISYKELRAGKVPPGSQMLVLGGIVLTLYFLDETLKALEELVPSIPDVRSKFVDRIDAWRRFRDDASHVVDRVLRESDRTKHDALYNTSGQGTLVIQVLGYDFKTDRLTTGAAPAAVTLGYEIDTGAALCDFASRRVVEEFRKGLVSALPARSQAGIAWAGLGVSGIIYEQRRSRYEKYL